MPCDCERSQRARRADDLNLVARYALIAFSAVTFALGVLSILLTLRTLRENRSCSWRHATAGAARIALTGAINRRGLEDAMPVEFSRAQRSEEPLTLVMIDLDHFKRYNDRRGHPAGDAVLRGAAQAWRKQLRPTDMLVRYGGEEFTLVLPGTDADQAAQLVDRLRALVPDRQTFSAGIATWDGREKRHRSAAAGGPGVAAGEEGRAQSNDGGRPRAAGHAAADGRLGVADAMSRQRILVVEDEPAIADTIVYALSTDGFEPQWCATGGAALEAARGGTFALAVLDVGLPDINGFELFKQLQQIGSGLPAIFLTARSS